MADQNIEIKAKQLEDLFRNMRKNRPPLPNITCMRGSEQRLLWLIFNISKESKIVKPSDLAKVTGVTMAGITHKLKMLEEKDYIRRITREENRREVEVMLTPKSRKIINEMRKHYWDKLCSLVSYLGVEETDRLIGTFSKIAKFIEKEQV